MNVLKLEASTLVGKQHPDITISAKTKDEFHLSVHSAAGIGSLSHYVFHDAVFRIAKNLNQEDFLIEEHLEKPELWLHFNPVGSIFHRLDMKQPKASLAGAANILLFRHPIEYEIRRNAPNTSLVISVSPDRFLKILEAAQAPRCRELERRMFRGPDDNILIDEISLTPGLQVVLHEILNAPFHGPLNRIFIEGKVHELLALRLASLVESLGKPARTPSLVLRSEDIEKIACAKQIMTSCLDDPPTISLLARRVGLNEFKLKHGFKRIFGNTIFGYLRELRLETALALVERREMNIAEIALEVGYRNPAHFAAAFRRRYGANPGSLLAEKRRSHSI